MNSRRAARAACEATTDMNNFLNVISQTPAAAGTAAGGAIAAVTGDTGAFAQLMGSLVPQAGAITPVTGGADSGEALPDLSAAATRDPAQQDTDAAITQPDAALIAALLGQLQMPHLMPPAPPPAQPLDEAARAAPFESAAGLSGADGVQTAADVAATPVAMDAPDAGDFAAAITGAPAQAARDDATAVLPAPSSVESHTPSDNDNAGGAAAAKVALPAATGDFKTPATTATATLSQTPPARDLSLVPAANAAAIASANPRAALSREAPSAASGTTPDGEGSKRPAASRNAGSTGEGIARLATAQAYADVRRVLELQPALGESDIPATAIAALRAAEGGSTPSRDGAFQEAPDRIGDFATVAAGVPTAFATGGERAASQFTLAPHVQSPEWQPAFAGNVKLLVKEGTSSATLQLNPAEFGPIDVRIVVTDQRADIAFMVTHPDANAAIQSALDELRDQLAQSGIQLGQTSVGAHAQQSQHSRLPFETPRRGAATGQAVTPAADNTPPARARASGNGAIDTYA